MAANSRGATRASGPLEQVDFREPLEVLPDKVWLGSPQGPGIYCNAAVRACAGSRNPHDDASLEAALVHPDDLTGIQLARNNVLAGANNRSIEARLTCLVGGWRWHRLSFSVLRGEQQVEAYLATATDIRPAAGFLAGAGKRRAIAFGGGLDAARRLQL